MGLLPTATIITLFVIFGLTAICILITLPHFLRPEEIKNPEDYSEV